MYIPVTVVFRPDVPSLCLLFPKIIVYYILYFPSSSFRIKRYYHTLERYLTDESEGFYLHLLWSKLLQEKKPYFSFIVVYYKYPSISVKLYY